MTYSYRIRGHSRSHHESLFFRGNDPARAGEVSQGTECSPSAEPWLQYPVLCKLGMVAHICDPRTQDLEAGDSTFEITFHAQ